MTCTRTTLLRLTSRRHENLKLPANFKCDFKGAAESVPASVKDKSMKLILERSKGKYPITKNSSHRRKGTPLLKDPEVQAGKRDRAKAKEREKRQKKMDKRKKLAEAENDGDKPAKKAKKKRRARAKRVQKRKKPPTQRRRRLIMHARWRALIKTSISAINNELIKKKGTIFV